MKWLQERGDHLKLFSATFQALDSLIILSMLFKAQVW